MRASTRTNKGAASTLLVSVVIALTLCLQLYASFLAAPVTQQVPLLKKLRGAALWPILDYPMFRRAHYPGDRIDRHALIAILADSTEIPIGNQDIAFWQRRLLHISIVEGDSARISEFVQLWESRNQRRLRGLRLENHSLVFTGSSLEESPREIVKDLVLPAPAVARQ